MLILSFLILIASISGLAVQLRRRNIAVGVRSDSHETEIVTDNINFLQYIDLASWSFVLLSSLASIVLLLAQR